MKPRVTVRTWLCGHVGHAFTRRWDIDGYGQPMRICWCGFLR